MAVVEREPIRVCDIFGGQRDVKRIKITVRYGESDNIVGEYEADMGPRARKRAIKLLEKATLKPGHGKRSKERASDG